MNKLSIRLRLEKLIIAIICILVVAVVVVTLLYNYNPGKNSNGALATVAMDVVCIMMMIILVLNLAFEKDEIGKSTKIFMGLLAASSNGLFFDFLTWTSDGSLLYGNYTFVFTVASLCSASITAAFLVLYLGNYMTEVYDVKSAIKWGRFFFAWNIIAFVITVGCVIAGKAFVFEGGHYKPGPLYDIVFALPVISVIVMSVYAIWHIKVIGLHDVVAVAGYIFIMVLGASVEAVYVMGTTYVGVAIADIFIFVMLQSKLLDRVRQEGEINVRKWMKKSNTDEMTGLLNRNAYEEDLALLEKSELRTNLAYVSVDINGLKAVNDKYGHSAGDELIIGAGKCLKQCLGAYGKVYRTGGDEFVGIIYATDAQLEGIVKDIKEVAGGWRGQEVERLYVSCGSAKFNEDENMTIHQMLVLSDKRMYEEKRQYYQTMGVDRRAKG